MVETVAWVPRRVTQGAEQDKNPKNWEPNNKMD